MTSSVVCTNPQAVISVRPPFPLTAHQRPSATGVAHLEVAGGNSTHVRRDGRQRADAHVPGSDGVAGDVAANNGVGSNLSRRDRAGLDAGRLDSVASDLVASDGRPVQLVACNGAADDVVRRNSISSDLPSYDLTSLDLGGSDGICRQLVGIDGPGRDLPGGDAVGDDAVGAERASRDFGARDGLGRDVRVRDGHASDVGEWHLSDVGRAAPPIELLVRHVVDRVGALDRGERSRRHQRDWLNRAGELGGRNGAVGDVGRLYDQRAKVDVADLRPAARRAAASPGVVRPGDGGASVDVEADRAHPVVVRLTHHAGQVGVHAPGRHADHRGGAEVVGRRAPHLYVRVVVVDRQLPRHEDRLNRAVHRHGSWRRRRAELGARVDVDLSRRRDDHWRRRKHDGGVVARAAQHLVADGELDGLHVDQVAQRQRLVQHAACGTCLRIDHRLDRAHRRHDRLDRRAGVRHSGHARLALGEVALLGHLRLQAIKDGLVGHFAIPSSGMEVASSTALTRPV